MPRSPRRSSPHLRKLSRASVIGLIVLNLAACFQPGSPSTPTTQTGLARRVAGDVTLPAPIVITATPQASPTPTASPNLPDSPTPLPTNTPLPSLTPIPTRPTRAVTATHTPLSTLAGYKAPDFTLEGLNITDGEEISLASIAGQPAVLVFFTTWCPDCRTLTPVIVETEPKVRKIARIIGIDLGESRSTVEDYVEKNGIKYPVALDSGYLAARNFQVPVIPTLIFIDSQGRIVNRYIGYLTSEDLIERIQNIVGR